jgi:hypothetical protein
VVATEASNGVNDVIRRQSGRDPASQAGSDHDQSGHGQPGQHPPGFEAPANNANEKRPTAG